MPRLLPTVGFLGSWKQPRLQLIPTHFELVNLDRLYAHHAPPPSEYGRRGIRDNVWGDRRCCCRIPDRKGNPRHYPYRQFLYLDTSKFTKLTPRVYRQAMTERQDIVDLLQENQEEMNLLADLYNEHKECLDQSKLAQDLERLRAYARLGHDFARKLTADS